MGPAPLVPTKLGVLARYRDRLPIGDATPDVDLHEGSTPLVPSRSIARALGLRQLYFKYEGLNPTGSFKDRGMVVAVVDGESPEIPKLRWWDRRTVVNRFNELFEMLKHLSAPEAQDGLRTLAGILLK